MSETADATADSPDAQDRTPPAVPQELHVAVLQMPVTRTIAANLAHIENGLTRAHADGVDILLTPRVRSLSQPRS